ncbi:P-loop containing nucleoside triphosphate hydrolase protein [Annulohypoxylon truncatum]|uniref:P-loop containing nucleoside triphosphate hydrolase protein n=1 Tax=Annulohypoxylon truncatum TaxID=327061 RepID=UPI002007479B|nr:P-loop containing nucleoside triphosphate hydrolase protein [Annulohypoxylon truncatum]KAI1211145.1 P-loop containing nucleoside triphosphate hydrolase protein [Annulohypoxylon truncatum]
MTRLGSKVVKYERLGSPAASLISDNTMPPPSPSPLKRKTPPTEYLPDNQSVARSFIRSHAPSAETWQRRDDDVEPIFMEMRRLPDSFKQGSPVSQTADASFAHQSFAHPTFTDIGLKQKACNDTLGDLQTLGVSHVAALPELVLVGDQSAGKSSLMSGLARVNLPRSAGVCTRCPLHIRLISSKVDHWSCSVSLQRDYDFRPLPDRKPKTSDVTAANPFPPWVKMTHRDTKPFKTIFDPSEIEEVLRWAQVAILNHNRNFELFIPGEGAMAKQESLDTAARETDAQFSPNIVALEIKGPGLPDLSFYDLPGVFQSPEKEEDEYVVKVVEKLTLEYIKREKAIIMWALPMNVDLENSTCLGIIRKAKAAPRTIGVMTKADQLPPQNIPNWLAMFRGEKQLVGQGFFATSRPPSQPLEDAAKWEELFFNRQVDGNSPWPIEFADFAGRCGVEVLLNFLSGKLTEAFARSLPSIKETVHRRIITIKEELDALPELPANVEHEVKRSLFKFLEQVKTAIRNTGFSSEWNTLNSQFQTCVFRMKPTCKVKDSELQTIDISGGDSEVATPSPSKRPRPSDSTMRNVSTPTRRPRQDSVATPVKHEEFATSSLSRASSVMGAPESRQSPFVKYFNRGRCAMDIKDIRNRILRTKRPGMPRDLVPDEVRETLCLDAVKKWEEPLDTYILKTAELLEKTANAALEESLGVLRRRLIFKDCQDHLRQFIEEAVASQRARLSDMFNSETYQLYMMNDDAFHRYKAQEMSQLLRVRGIIRLKSFSMIDWDYTAKRLEDMSEEDKIKERKMLDANLPKLGKDPYDTEIEVAGFVRGYYMMAAARFVEGVTMNVNSNLLRTFREQQLDMALDEKFHIYSHSDPSQYNRLMEEDDRTAKRRLRLKGEMDKLLRAMQSINELGSFSGDAIDAHSSSGVHGTSADHLHGTVESDCEMDDAVL